MAQLAAGIAGAALLGPAGLGLASAGVGFAVGSIAYSLLNPQQINGPKLSDLRVQISSYGAPIPRVWGSAGLSGNVFWATKKIGTETEESAKGGPTVTTTSYTCSFAVLIGEGQHTAIRRVWAGSRLAYDISDPDDVAAQAASSTFARYFTFYPGSESQLPDPTMESYLGVGNVPAFLGSCYVVFKDYPLEKDGNNVPSLLIELTGEDPTAGSDGGLVPLQIHPWEVVDGVVRHSNDGVTNYEVRAFGTTSGDSGTLIYSGTDFAAALAVKNAAFPDYGDYIGYFTYTQFRLSTFGQGTDIDDGLGPRYVGMAFHTKQPDFVIWDGDATGEEVSSTACFLGINPDAPEPDSYLISSQQQDHPFMGHPLYGYATMRPYLTLAGPDNLYLQTYCTNYPPDGGGYFPGAWSAPFAIIRAERIPSLPAQTCEIGDPCLLGIAQLPSNDRYCISCDGEVTANFSYELQSGTYKQLQEYQQSSSLVLKGGLPPVLALGDPNYNNEAFWTAAADAAGLSGTYNVDYPVVVDEAGVGSAESVGADASFIELEDLLTSVCLECGYTEDQLLFTGDFSAQVPGYVRTAQQRGRELIEPLRTVYWFDVVENGALLQFVKRGGAPVFALTADDLGAGEGQADELLLQVLRAQEAELPAEVTINYLSRARDYEPASQQDRRQSTGSVQKLSISPAIVLEDQTAANAAAVAMYDAWTSRTRLTWSTTRAYTHLLPADTGTIDDGEALYDVRITDKSEEGPVIRWSGVLESASNYSPAAAAALLPDSGSGVLFEGPTKLELLDVPMLREVDNDAGYYAAVAAYTSSWPGARLFRSANGGVSFGAVRDMSLRATLGYAQTVLGAWAGGNLVDEANTVTVRLHGSGALASVTRAALLGDANAALLGSELIQFRTATLVSAGVYTLSGLLRGRLGTEQHMGTHAVNERFVLLTPQVYRIPAPLAETNVAAPFKAVTIGQTLAEATSQSFTNTAAGLKPLSPVHLEVLPTAAGYIAQWVRRTRIGPVWADGLDVPLGEASERYRVRVLDGAVVVEEQLVTSTTATLAPAAPGDYDGLSCEVVQLSDLVGAGFPATETI